MATEPIRRHSAAGREILARPTRNAFESSEQRTKAAVCKEGSALTTDGSALGCKFSLPSETLE